MKYSKQREVILDVVRKKQIHLTANEIYESVKQRIPNISLGTVYRNLNILVEHKMIRKIVMPFGSDQFDFTLTSHSHMYCANCNKIYDINISLIEHVNKLIEHESGYKIISSDIVFEGICLNCQKDRKKD